MKTLKCADMGYAECPAVFKAETVDEVLAQAGEHAKTVHNAVATPEMAEKAKSLINDEPSPAPAQTSTAPGAGTPPAPPPPA